MIKRCSKCHKLKRKSQFKWRDSNGQEGTAKRCLRCRKESHRHPLPEMASPRYWIRPHAMHRYIERVRPDLLNMNPTRAHKKARSEMILRMRDAPLLGLKERPEWLDGMTHPMHRGFLQVDENTLFCLRAYKTHTPGVERVQVSTVVTKI